VELAQDAAAPWSEAAPDLLDLLHEVLRRRLRSGDPNVGLRPMFFAAYAKLLSRGEEKPCPRSAVSP